MLYFFHPIFGFWFCVTSGAKVTKNENITESLLKFCKVNHVTKVTKIQKTKDYHNHNNNKLRSQHLNQCLKRS